MFIPGTSFTHTHLFFYIGTYHLEKRVSCRSSTIQAIFVYNLQTMEKTAFESLSRDFPRLKMSWLLLTNLCQGQLKISRENAKLPRKPRNRKGNYSPKTFSDLTPFSPIPTKASQENHSQHHVTKHLPYFAWL